MKRKIKPGHDFHHFLERKMTMKTDEDFESAKVILQRRK